MEIHPSQRRRSCELCRKTKTKCQRVAHSDLKCKRCTTLGANCDSGEQKKVGRPKGRVQKSSLPREGSSAKCTPINGSSKQPRHALPITSMLQNRAALRHPPGMLEIWDMLSQKSTQRMPGSMRPVMGAYTSVLPQDARGFAFSTPSWPTVMTDSWYQRVLPGVANIRCCRSPNSSRTSSQSGTGGTWSAQTTRTTACCKACTPLFEPSSNARQSHGPHERVTYYVDKNQFSTVEEQVTCTPSIANSIKLLAEIQNGLEVRSKVAEHIMPTLDLNAIIYHEGPLFIGQYSLGEYLMKASQDLTHILESFPGSQLTAHESVQDTASRLIPTILVTYSQLLSFYELVLEHLVDRVERIFVEPVVPIPGFTLDSKPVELPCRQGIVFCSTVQNILGRLEQVLGISPVCKCGLLTSKQIISFWAHLDASNSLASGVGIMRPIDVRNLFMHTQNVLERLEISC